MRLHRLDLTCQRVREEVELVQGETELVVGDSRSAWRVTPSV